jgi:CBS-domain-containing membrane protein
MSAKTHPPRQELAASKVSEVRGRQKANRLQRFLIMQAKDVMTQPAVSVSPRLTLRELESLFDIHGFNGLPVAEDHHLAGMVTQFDFLKHFVFTPGSVFPHYDQLMKRTVEEIMTREVCTVHPDTPLTRVLQLMVDTRDKSLPVVDSKNRLVGMISRGDMVRAFRR